MTPAAWRRLIWSWFHDQGDWTTNVAMYSAFDADRKVAGLSRAQFNRDVRWLVLNGHLEKRIDYDQHPNPRSPMMPFVEHRAVGEGP